jgi:hypothetical protein
MKTHEAVEGRKGLKSKALRRLMDAKKMMRTGGGEEGRSLPLQDFWFFSLWFAKTP